MPPREVFREVKGTTGEVMVSRLASATRPGTMGAAARVVGPFVMIAFDQLLKKNFWLVTLPLVGAVAYLNAQAVGQLVGIGLAPDDKTLSTAGPAAKTPVTTAVQTRQTSAEPILNHNPFDHTKLSLKPPPVEAVESSEPQAPIDPQHAPKCDGVKILVITASDDPDWSFAAFAGSDGKSFLRRRGGDVNGKTLRFVGADRVWLDNAGSLCQASLFDKAEVKPAAPSAPAPVASAPAPQAGGKGLDPEIRNGIKRVGGTEFNVDRGVLDRIIENQAELMKVARIAPEQENGKVVGLRLLNIKPDSLLGVLGLENGDRLQTINGFDMGSPEKALEAYARLRTAEKLTISINRKGQNMNYDYNIK